MPGRRRAGLVPQWPCPHRRGYVGCTRREREIQRQLDRLICCFPVCRDAVEALLDFTDPRVPHSARQEHWANELAEAMSILLASLSERSGDTSPALRFTCGRSP